LGRDRRKEGHALFAVHCLELAQVLNAKVLLKGQGETDDRIRYVP